jgi:hypothetical protein
MKAFESSQLTSSDEMIGESRWTRECMLVAMRNLETALARAAHGREPAWGERVASELAVLEREMQRQLKELDDDDSTLAAIARNQPRLLPRIEQLRKQYADLVEQIAALRSQLTDEGCPAVAEVRQRIAWLLTAIRHFQAKETDLIFEAINVDIGIGD